MPATLPIGDFARATHISIKALRHYHQIGLLEPAHVDRGTGYRHYTAEQIPTAQVIRRFRDLEMPLDEIQVVLTAPDMQTRNDRIAAHLDRLERTLARTAAAAESLRDLLREPPRSVTAVIEHRSVQATPAAAISELLDLKDASLWYLGALGELRATLAAQGLTSSEPAGGIFSNDLFAYERGQATIFLPCADTVRPVGRVVSLVIPAVELATTIHAGPDTNIDQAYGALGAHVAKHALAVKGPLREYYLVTAHDTPDEQEWRTEIGWPIFQVGGASTAAR
jgi:DNA-binding transcriptional MerR regulator